LRLDIENDKLTQWESELEEYRGRVDNLSERAQTTMLGVRNVVASLHQQARARLDAEYESLGKELDLTEAENQQRSGRLKDLLGAGIETLQNWMQMVRQAKLMSSTAEEKLQVVENVGSLIKKFSLDVPGLSQTFCSCTKTPTALIGTVERSSLSIEPHERKVLAWWYMNDLGTFTPWPQKSSEALEREYSRRSLQATVEPYKVDFSAMTQLNLETSAIRRIKRQPLPNWTWQFANEEHRPYKPSVCFKLEQAYSLRHQSVTLRINGVSYDVDFATSTQTNQATGMTRHIRRS
jgi:hypothetical protein